MTNDDFDEEMSFYIEKNYPYRIHLIFQDLWVRELDSRHDWLNKNIGEEWLDWMVSVYDGHKLTYYFREEQDAVNFSLTFG